MTKRHNALTTVISVISISGRADSQVEARTQPERRHFADDDERGDAGPNNLPADRFRDRREHGALPSDLRDKLADDVALESEAADGIPMNGGKAVG